MRDRHGRGGGREGSGDGIDGRGSAADRRPLPDGSGWRAGLRTFARRLRTGGGALAITLIVGLANPGLAPRSAAQTPPTGFDLIGDQTPVSLLGELPAHDPTVGRTMGSGGVSGGAATYDIPIVVPPGRRGMQPELSLGYSSRAGNGVAGMGWSLNGLSSLHRCPMTMDQDGQIKAVTLTATDRLCLDGQRLVLTSGVYGAANATYGTELDSFVRVTQLGGDLVSAATYFKVERKSGEIAWYGEASGLSYNARVIPGGVTVPLTWMIRKVEDRVGNAMDYVYANHGEGETLIESIYYTGFGGTLGSRRVAFNYDQRPTGAGTNDISSSYLAGGVTRQTKRLATVVTFAGNEAVRGWVLNYGSAISSGSGRSLLQSVTDCAYDGANWICKSPVSFTWQQGPATYSLTKPALMPASSGAVSGKLRPLGDMDGDGATEVVVDLNKIVSLTPERTVRWTMTIPTQYILLPYDQSADFNQDGRVDFVARDTATNTFAVRTWSGSPTDTNFATAFGNIVNTGIVANGNEALKHVGDVDGDGRADLVVQRVMSTNAGSCSQKIFVYRNQYNGASPPTFPEVASHCLNVPHVGDAMYEGEQVQSVRDFDGDGLADIFVESALQFWPVPIGSERGRLLSRILFGTKSGGTYSLTTKLFVTLFPASQPQDAHEIKAGLFSLWLDVNGDGLDDWMYVGYDVKWKLRYNRGGVLGPIHDLNTNVGLAGCGDGSSNSNLHCAEVWQPWQAQHLQAGDTDGDGRAELLYPTAFAANMCTYKYVDNGACPGGDGTGWACQERWVCPENPVTGQAPPLISGVSSDTDGNGHPDSTFSQITVGSHQKGWPDFSTYKLSALKIMEGATGAVSIATTTTGALSGAVNMPADDVYGDGQTDQLLMTSPEYGLRDSFGIRTTQGEYPGTPVPPSESPTTLPNGLPIFTGHVLVNENTGPSAAKNADGLTPQTQDVIASVNEGFGLQVQWRYSPLAGKAGRMAGTTPLYTVPMVASQRYIDERHIYFTSSMNVVAEMLRSDGIGGLRTWRYGYGEAVYHTQGRGFQGFRTIIEEDVLAGLRTTTTFHQKFPLTSQPERIVVNPIARTGEDGPISKEQYTWRCDRTNRANTAACTPTPGTLAKWFPFLDTKESWTFDATTAASGGTPAVLGYTQEVAAEDATCSGSFASTSGYDAYGNLLNRTTHARDLGTGSASGTANRLDRQCVREITTVLPDASAWWLDRVSRKEAITQVTWDGAQHALPSGTSNPARSLITDFAWNPDRTLATEIRQPGVANQQVVTAYTYPATGNYGLPSGVGVTADGDPNGSRSVGTSYSADGYFPLAVANALGHSATTTVRAKDGQPVSVTDANGLRTLTDYDAFGLATKQRYRGATDSVYVAPDRHTAVVRCTTSFCWLPIEQYQTTTVQDGTPTSLARYDGFGRTTLDAQLRQDAVWTHAFREYAARGQLRYQTEPFSAGDPMAYAFFEYNDILGRMTKKIVPKQGIDGRGDLVTTYGFSGRTTNIQVCGSNDVGTGNCLNLSRTTDSLGRYVETRDALNGRTRFWYEANGNVSAIEDAKNVVTQASYNAIGQRTSVNDPNQGTWSFLYNALGEVLGQTDARGIVTTMTYDKLSRPLTRNATIDVTGDNVADQVNDSWSYDPANAKGAPLSESRSINGLSERTTTQTYDNLARPIQSDIVQRLTSGTGNYRLRTKYDSYYGRPVGQEFPNGEAVQALYSIYGHAIAEKDPVTGTEYRRTNSVNARGQATQETFGNGVILNPQYQWQTGQLTELKYSKAGTDLRKLGYGYDVFGNLKRQTLNTNQSQEDYSYDQLHRLVQSIRSGAASGTVSYGFDAVGNFTKKTDFSTSASNAYSYTGGACGGGANAVKQIALAAGGTRTYCYDANGNLTSDNAGLSLKYDHMGMTTVAQRGALRDDFRYGADGSRTRSWGSDGSRIYLPGYEHRIDTNETKVYVGDYAVITNGSAGRKVEYLLKDRLGSVDAVASSAGAITETRGYDAFGKPRSGTWADLTPPKLGSTNVTPKGFTQHEHLNQLELIHMNGRVFDYNVGRFTGVDPVIQFPLNSQSLNPYSYILNNPLSGTDPTGYRSQSSVCHVGNEENNANGCSSITVDPSGSMAFQQQRDSKFGSKSGQKNSRIKTENSNGADRGQSKDVADAQKNDVSKNQDGLCANPSGKSASQTTPVAQQKPVDTRVLIDPRYNNIYWSKDVTNDQTFKDDIAEIIKYSIAHGLTDFQDLDDLAGREGTAIYLTNRDPITGRKEKSMNTFPAGTGRGPAIILSVNPRSGLVSFLGSKQSPATGLIHEIGHAINLLRRPGGVKGFLSMSPREQRIWQGQDDNAVIRGAESRAAMAFGEQTRMEHKPKRIYTATCPTCTEEER